MCVKIQLYHKKSEHNLLSVARLFHQGCSVDMFRWICFKKHDSGCIFRMIYIDKPFKYTLPCPDMILQVASMAASAWCYHCSPYPSYTQWRFRGFLYVYFAYFVCFSSIFILFILYVSLDLWWPVITALKSLTNQAESVTDLDVRHRKITKILSNTCYLDMLGLPQSRSAGVSCSTFDTRYLVPTIPDIATSPSPITDIADTRHTARLITMHGINNRKQLVQHYLQNGPSLLTWSRVLF